MRKILSALFSTLQGGVRGGLLFLALLTTTNLWAYDFQSGDLYYNITSDTTVEVTYQYEWSYDNYAGLTTATIPETVTYNGTTYSVTSIGYNAFGGCSSLTSVTIPNSVTSIGDYAFSECSSLRSITLSESVMSIGCSAFYGCSSLTSITIPNSVTSIGNDAFSGCSSLTSITIPESVTSIADYAFRDCSSLTSITIPNSITSIGGWAFQGCSSLSSVTIGNSVESIGSGAFDGCSSLSSVTIGNGVESIGNGAFYGCTSLSTITIPNRVKSIGEASFVSCSSLTTVICEAIEVPELGGGVFYQTPFFEATLYVPAQSLDDYKIADQWKYFGTILPIEESEEEIELHDTEMTIVFTNSEDNDSEIYRQTITIKMPPAPEIAGFTFLYWQPVAEPITNEITIQAIYEADTPTSAEVYTNPANPAQKLLRNGQVYILQDGKTYTITGQKL